MTAATLLLGTMLVWQRGRCRSWKGKLSRKRRWRGLMIGRARRRSEISTSGWPTLQQPAGGYLGIRYIALTRGVGALEPRFRTAGGDRDSSSSLPRTQRDLLNELLPSSQRAMNPRS